MSKSFYPNYDERKIAAEILNRTYDSDSSKQLSQDEFIKALKSLVSED